MDIQQNNVAVLHFNLVNQDGSTIFIRKTKLATFNLINPSEVSVPITDIGFDATLNQCWIRVPKESNATTGQYYGVLNIVDDDWGTYTTSKIKVYSVVSDADEDTKSVVFTATCIATQVTNPSGGNSPYYNTTTSTWWQYSDTLKAFEDTGVGNLIKYITKNVQHLKDGTGNGSIVTCLDDEISANNMATGLCSTDFGKNNENRGESCVALGENNFIAEGVSNATAIAGAQLSAADVFAVGDKTKGHKNVFEINKFGDIYFRPDSSQERIVILQDILDSVIKNVVYDSSKYSLTVTFYSAADNANKIKTYDLSGLKAVLKDDAVKKISVNQSTAVMTVDTINGSSQQIQLPITKISTYVKSFVRTFQAASPVCFDAVTDQDGTTKTLFSPALFMKEPQTSLVLDNVYTGNSGGQTEYFKWFYDQYQITESTSSAINTFFNLPIDFATKPDCTPFVSSHVIVPTLSCMNGALANYLPLTGNAATATKATQDGNGNVITSTYLPLTGGTLTSPIDSTYSSPSWIDGVSHAAVNCKGSGGYVGWINGPTATGRASIATCPYQDNVMYFSYGTAAAIAAGTNVVTTIQFDLAASSILASSATFNSSTEVTLSSYGSEPLTIGQMDKNLGFDGNEIQARANAGASDLYLNRKGGPVHFGANQYYISSDGSNYSGNAATATKLATARSITLSGDTTGTATFDGSDNITITTSTNYAPSSIQPFNFFDSNENGTFWTQTNTNSIAVPFMTDSKVVTHKVRIFIGFTNGAKIRCAIYKKESEVLSLVTQTQLYTGLLCDFIDIPFETVATLDSDTLYFFAFECSSSDSNFLGKQINASLITGFVYKGDAFNAGSDNFKSQYPTDGPVDGDLFLPYFKII